jgi:hypothetical protein
MQEIHRRRRAAAGSSSGYPGAYAYQHPLIMWDVAPGAADTITVVKVPAPTAASNSSHDLADATYGGIPVDYHDAVALYAERFLASYDDDASSAQGARYKEWYDERVKDCRREMAVRGGGRLPNARLGRGRRLAPHDPSRDSGF